MSRKERVFEDDDGRTIADMSEVSRPGLLRHSLSSEHSWQRTPEAEQDIRKDRPWEDHSLSHEEERMYVFGALKAALLIAFAFIGGLGIVTAFLLWLWR